MNRSFFDDLAQRGCNEEQRVGLYYNEVGKLADVVTSCNNLCTKERASVLDAVGQGYSSMHCVLIDPMGSDVPARDWDSVEEFVA
jgi:hypothetical protein